MIKFGEENRKYDPNRSQYFAKALLPKGKFKVLDCGAGLGEFATIMRDRGLEVVCVEGNEDFIEITKQKGFEGYVCDCDEERLPFDDESFDGIVMVEVIEHLFNTKKILKEIKRVLKPNGWFVITTPNYSFWIWRIKHLFGQLYSAPNSRHKRFFSSKTITKVLKENGFKIEDYLGGSVIPKIRIRFSIKILPNLLAEQIGFRCKKQ